MLQIGKQKTNKRRAFSLIEIIVSLAIFSILITTVITISITMMNVQKKIQAELFLAQTAQTTLESMSRQIRYGYYYTGMAATGNYDGSLTITSNIIQNTDLSSDCTSAVQSLSSSTTCLPTLIYSQNSSNAQNSPYIIFESQNGNPNDLSDQIAYCAKSGRLFKITKFDRIGSTYSASCDATNGAAVLPDDIMIDSLSFDIYAGDSQNPKNPMVRIKMRLRHSEGGVMDMQSTVTQRLISYF